MLLCDVYNLVGFIPFRRSVYARELEKLKKSRLLGLDAVKAAPKPRSFASLQEKSLSELSPEDWNIIIETEEEWYRRGHFDRIFPLPETIDYYSQFFESPRYSLAVLSKWFKAGCPLPEDLVQVSDAVV
eukprot:GILI01089439.1.p1 GENE.GILI01089439.1~~GILI01089439.1.p1  ORF type:complete len:139 (+),score=23.15 GILI01089439.1:33-419(+)